MWSSLRTHSIPRWGRVELRREKSRGRPQYVVGPLELGVLLAQRHQLGAFVGGEPVVALAGIGLGLMDPGCAAGLRG
ncbi:hypothetical protein ADL01_36075 [Streptomyces sp. NRRL WC-3618]|nr:hypothetical protein ADL01_36075 [Streptomyces sp. NRRL WC-3618]